MVACGGAGGRTSSGACACRRVAGFGEGLASADIRGTMPLNPAQERAATHPSGPLLIIAGAGTGKTQTLAHRVAHLIEQGADPGRILLLTFTRRAAEIMIRGGKAGGPWVGTVHSILNRLLRLHAQSFGLDPSFTVLDRSDSADLLNVVRHDL